MIKILSDTPKLVTIIHSRYMKFIFKAKLNIKTTLKDKQVELTSIEQLKKIQNRKILNYQKIQTLIQVNH